MTTKSKTKPDLETDVQLQRISILEAEVERLNNDMQVMMKVMDTLSYNIKETQQFAIKIGVAQGRIQERVLRWPFVRVTGEDSKE